MRRIQELFVGIFAALSLLTSDARAAANAPAGTVLLIKGDVHVIDPNAKVVADMKGEHGRRKLDVGAPFYVGETIVTKEGRAKLKFVEGNNEVVVGTNTSLLVERASTDPLKATGTSLSLARGEVRSSVNHKYSGKGGDVYEVKTPNAVAGVRGTIFLARFNPQSFKSEVATERGLVSVKSVTGGGAGREVMVRPGMFTSTAGTAAPAAPAPISKNPELEQSVKSLGGSGEKGDDEAGGSKSEVGPSDGAKKDDKDQKQDKQEVAKSDSAKSEESGEKQDQKDQKQEKQETAKNDSDKKDQKQEQKQEQKQDQKQETAKNDSGDKKDSGPAKQDGAPAKQDGSKQEGGSSTAKNDAPPPKDAPPPPGAGSGDSKSGGSVASSSKSSAPANNSSSAPLGREPVATSSSGGRAPASVPGGFSAPSGTIAGLPSNPAGPPPGASLSPISDIASKAINNANANAAVVNKTVNQQTQQIQRITGKGIIEIK